MSNFTVVSDDEATELRKLREFYKEVRSLTANHDVIENGDVSMAVVYPKKLSDALCKINPEWFHIDTVP